MIRFAFSRNAASNRAERSSKVLKTNYHNSVYYSSSYFYFKSRFVDWPPLEHTNSTHLEVYWIFKLNLACAVSDICQTLGHTPIPYFLFLIVEVKMKVSKLNRRLIRNLTLFPRIRQLPWCTIRLVSFTILTMWLPRWCSGQSSRLQIQRSGFDSRCYQIFWEVVGLERGPLSLMSTTEELPERKSSVSGLKSREYAPVYPLR
jgi:hypothetical protein